ncbi:MAG: phytanoyl-CoA dioxygenase family protein [Rhodospirillaceae bacterium]|nr:phytanoyl-CoA dioxygenase family protein [Rhodospirillaceae bacterium]
MVKRFNDGELAEFAAFYEEHGAVKLPGLIEPDWVSRILHEVDVAAAHADDPEPKHAISYGRGPGRMTIRYMWRVNPVVRSFLLREELVEALARIVDTSELRLWFDLTFIHDTSAPGADGGEGSRWHHDASAFVWKGQKLPSLWMALTPSDENRSRLMFIDGSHKKCPGYYRPPSNSVNDKGETLSGYYPVPECDALVAEGKAKILTWDCQPGDAIVIHPQTLHGARGVKGNQGRRVAMTTRWLGDDCRWVPGLYDAGGRGIPGLDGIPGLPQSELNKFYLGDRPRGDLFPLVWPKAA